MRSAVAEGYSLPGVVLDGIDETIAAHVVDDPTQSLLYAPFEDFPEQFSDADRKRLTRVGIETIKDSVVRYSRKYK